MKKKNYHIAVLCFLLFWLIFAGAPVLASGENGGGQFAKRMPLVEEKTLLNLINQARVAPLQMAASLGMDPDKVLQDLPELEEILKGGLPALGFDRNLYVAAAGHTEDMLANNYYSQVSPDGRGVDDRIRETGYNPLSTGEALGLLAFNNFIEPGYAASVIFEKMFKAELDPAGTEERRILNPAFTEVGVSMAAGMFEISGAPWNVYIAVTDFAESFDLYAVKKGLWRLINEARKSPAEAIAAAGIDEAAARDALGDDAWMIKLGLPPLAWNEKLEKSADGHYSDMYLLYYYDTLSSNGATPAERIAVTGYEAVKADEVLGSASFFDAATPEEIAVRIFQAMLWAELNPENDGENVIFNAEPREIGIACGKVYIESEDGRQGSAFIAVADFALPTKPKTFLVGNVYEDVNDDFFYNSGEGIEGLTVAVGMLGNRQECGYQGVQTDSFGNYQIEISPGFIDITVFYELGTNLRSDALLWFENFNLLVDLRVKLPEILAATPKNTRPAPAATVPSLSITW